MLECKRLYEFNSGLILDLNRVITVHPNRRVFDCHKGEYTYEEWRLVLENDIGYTFEEELDSRAKFVDALINYLSPREQ